MAYRIFLDALGTIKPIDGAVEFQIKDQVEVAIGARQVG
jgi:hypothetical protein